MLKITKNLVVVGFPLIIYRRDETRCLDLLTSITPRTLIRLSTDNS